jgi:hypothetical protein
MILVRDIFQLKFGKAREALAIWKEGTKILRKNDINVSRVLTDLTGQYYTLIMESTYDSLSAFDNAMKTEVASDEWKAHYQKFVPLVESGRREIFTIVE